jgi:ribonuclease BN (tRNA processing enzyme)
MDNEGATVALQLGKKLMLTHLCPRLPSDARIVKSKATWDR